MFVISPMATQAQPAVGQLGRVHAEFKPSASSVILWLVVLAILFGIFAIVVSSSDPSNTALYVIGLGIFVLIALGLVGSLFLPRMRVVQHERGLVIYHGKQLSAVVPWEHIVHVRQSIMRFRTYGVTTRTMYRYVVQTWDGRSFVFTNSLSHIKELGECIQQATFPIIWARNLAAVNAGQPVQFGTLTLNQAGLWNGNSGIAWSEVSGARVNNGRIHIKRAGRWLNWANKSVAQIPDALVLIALLNYLTGPRGR